MSTAVQTKPSVPTDTDDRSVPLVSVVIPCLNEAENIEECVTAALQALATMGVQGEVVVADNDSEDDSARLAELAGARVVVERRRGYGSAYLAGFAASTGRYIVMADADLTYDFKDIPRFVAALEDGAEMVIVEVYTPGASPALEIVIELESGVVPAVVPSWIHGSPDVVTVTGICHSGFSRVWTLKVEE